MKTKKLNVDQLQQIEGGGGGPSTAAPIAGIWMCNISWLFNMQYSCYYMFL